MLVLMLVLVLVPVRVRVRCCGGCRFSEDFGHILRLCIVRR